MATPTPTPARPLNTDALRKFFIGKGHHNIVLLTSDLRRMAPDMQLCLVELLKVVEHPAAAAGEIGPSAPVFIVLPWGRIGGRFQAQHFAQLQEVIFSYRDVRGLQPVKKPCERCGGAGCSECEGTGKTTTFQEMTPDEIAVAEAVEPVGLCWWKD